MKVIWFCLCTLVVSAYFANLVSCKVGAPKKYRPVVLLHGLDNSSMSMDYVASEIRKTFPGMYVRNLEIGDGWLDSLTMPLQKQTQIMCDKLKADENLKDGLNIVGYSQGALISRAYIEKCNDPPVHNFVSWVGPHGGTFGIPSLNDSSWFWQQIEPYVGPGMYDYFPQHMLTIPQFWRDPFLLDVYSHKSLFLSDINNVLPERRNQTYIDHFSSLNTLSLLRSSNPDISHQILYPEKTTWFSTFAANSDTKVLPMEETTLYLEDWIGLKKLHTTNRVHFFESPCAHGNLPTVPCWPYLIPATIPFLNNTLP